MVSAAGVVLALVMVWGMVKAPSSVPGGWPWGAGWGWGMGCDCTVGGGAAGGATMAAGILNTWFGSTFTPAHNSWQIQCRVDQTQLHPCLCSKLLCGFLIHVQNVWSPILVSLRHHDSYHWWTNTSCLLRLQAQGVSLSWLCYTVLLQQITDCSTPCSTEGKQMTVKFPYFPSFLTCPIKP